MPLKPLGPCVRVGVAPGTGWGRLTMSVADSAAEEYLSFAFEHCHRSSQKNKRMVLIYLLPVKMLLVSGLSSSLGACPLQGVRSHFTA